jgi:hypothetical protein
MPDLPADPAVDEALLADVGRVGEDLRRMAGRLAGDSGRETPSSDEPRALLDVIDHRLVAPPDTSDPEIDFFALRIGVGLGRLARLANA